MIYRYFFSIRCPLVVLLCVAFASHGLAQGTASAPAAASANPAWAALQKPGSIVLLRHALAPGVGDPPGFVLGDCSTQRNLNDEGREQARRIGQTLAQRGVRAHAVWHSQWCRTAETAQLLGLAYSATPRTPQPSFNSFFGTSGVEPAQTAAARKLLLDWQGPGTLVVVTHQVNITALTGVVPQSGEGVVLLREGGKLVVKGAVLP